MKYKILLMVRESKKTMSLHGNDLATLVESVRITAPFGFHYPIFVTKRGTALWRECDGEYKFYKLGNGDS